MNRYLKKLSALLCMLSLLSLSLFPTALAEDTTDESTEDYEVESIYTELYESIEGKWGVEVEYENGHEETFYVYEIDDEDELLTEIADALGLSDDEVEELLDYDEEDWDDDEDEDEDEWEDEDYEELMGLKEECEDGDEDACEEVDEWLGYDWSDGEEWEDEEKEEDEDEDYEDLYELMSELEDLCLAGDEDACDEMFELEEELIEEGDSAEFTEDWYEYLEELSEECEEGDEEACDYINEWSMGEEDDEFWDAWDDWEDEDYYETVAEELKEAFWELDTHLEELAAFIDEITTMMEEDGLENKEIDEALMALDELYWILDTALEEIIMMLESDLGDEAEEILEEIWEFLEEAEEYADEYIEIIEEELDMEYDLEFDEDYEDEGEFEDFLEEYYGTDNDYSDLLEELEAEIAEQLVQEITEALMEELLAYMDDEDASQVISNVMNNVDVLGDEGAELLDNTNEVYAVLDAMNFPDAGGEAVARILELHDESYTVLADSTHEELAAVWGELKAEMDANGGAYPDEDTLNSYSDRIEDILEDNEMALIFEEEVEYYDVDLDDAQWFYDDVQSLRNDDIVDGFKDENGDLTGFFGPAENITYAEVLKMLMEGSNSVGPDAVANDSTAQGQWFEGYVATAENLNLTLKSGEWNEAADRRTVAVWVTELFGLTAEGTTSPFSDVDSGDADLAAFIAVYEAGIFTGDDGTGALRPDEGINRAEASKVVNVAVDNATSSNTSIEDLVSSITSKMTN